MNGVNSRRERYAAITRHAVLDAAMDLFVERGFGVTSVDEIARVAEVSKGAVYHHFSDKRDIFSELFTGVQEQVMNSVITAADKADTDWERVAIVLHTFLDAYTKDTNALAILKQAAAVLSQDTIREIDEHVALPFVRNLLEQLREKKLLHPVPVAPTARMIFGLLCEATTMLTGSDEPADASREIEIITLHLLSGLLKTH